MPSAEPAALKAGAAAAAVELVEDGMLVGLGTGSTAEIFVDLLGARVREGLRLTGVPTSKAIAARAAAAGIALVEEIDRPLDLAVDGADEIDPGLNLVKGRGGALVREKLVALASRRFVVVADDSKLVSRLGAGAVPVEVVPFLWAQTAQRLEALGASWALRGGDSPIVTDNGNLVLDCRFDPGIGNPRELSARLKAVVGVVDHGIFAGVAALAIVAGPAGVRHLRPHTADLL